MGPEAEVQEEMPKGLVGTGYGLLPDGIPEEVAAVITEPTEEQPAAETPAEPEAQPPSEPQKALPYQKLEEEFQGFDFKPEPAPGEDINFQDYGVPEEQVPKLKSHFDQRAQIRYYEGLVDAARSNHDGADGLPSYDEALQKSGVSNEYVTGSNPKLAAFLKSKRNPPEVAYRMALNRLGIGAKAEAPKQPTPPAAAPAAATNGTQPLQTPAAPPPAAPAPKPVKAAAPASKGISGLRGTPSIPESGTRYTVKSLAELSDKDPAAYGKVPKHIRDAAISGTLPKE